MHDAMPRDDVGVDIGGIGRLGHKRRVDAGKQVEDGAEIVACTARNENFVRVQLDAAHGIVTADRFLQKRRAALRHISVKRLLLRLIVHRLVHGGNDRVAQRQRHVADTQPQQMRRRVLRRIGVDALLDVIEKIGAFQLVIMYIRSHGPFPPQKPFRRVPSWSHRRFHPPVP